MYKLDGKEWGEIVLKGGAMEFRQKRFTNKTNFELREHDFTFAIEEKGGSSEAILEYADLPFETTSLVERNVLFANLGGLWLLLGVYQVGEAFMDDRLWIGRLTWVFSGIACLAFYWFSATKWTVFSGENSTIYVLKDAQHDAIIAELEARRKNQLLSWYGEVNPENEIEQEINKFHWLRNHDLISEEEAEAKILLAKQVFAETGAIAQQETRH